MACEHRISHSISIILTPRGLVVEQQKWPLRVCSKKLEHRRGKASQSPSLLGETKTTDWGTDTWKPIPSLMPIWWKISFYTNTHKLVTPHTHVCTPRMHVRTCTHTHKNLILMPNQMKYWCIEEYLEKFKNHLSLYYQNQCQYHYY
jgi:hypothetical protein